jgi:hypothetical protein
VAAGRSTALFDTGRESVLPRQRVWAKALPGDEMAIELIDRAVALGRRLFRGEPARC